MKKTLTKVLLVLLALAMVLGSMALLGSCGGKEEKKDDPEDDTPGTTDVLAKLPDVNYSKNGTKDKFIILCRDEGQEFLREDSGSDNIDKEIYMRNQKIETKYGVELVAVNEEYYLIPDKVGDIIKAADTDQLDLVNNHIVYSSNIAIAGNALNWQEVPYIDLTADWWAKSNLQDLTIDDQTYIIIGDMQTSAISATYCMFYNKDLADTYGLGDIYQTVMDKEWTYTKMLETIAKVGKVDLDKNGKYNAKDRYGLVTFAGSGVNAYIWAFNNPIFTKDDAGDLAFTFMTKKLSTIMTNLVSLYHKNEAVYVTGAESDDPASMFVGEQAVFMNNMFSAAMGSLRDMDSKSWGIIPYPMWNAAQAKTVGYQTSVDGGHNAMMAPFFRNASESKTEQLGVITEALTALSHTGLRVAYFDKALKAQYVGDPKEAAMIDMLMDCRVFDFGYIYLAFSSPAFWLQIMVPERNSNIASYYASKKSALNSAIEEAFAIFGREFEGLS